jgi:hypothetical protein
MIRADSLAGTGTIGADGLSANTADTTPDNDGGGGGGGGGTVLVFAPNGGFAGLSVSARGGPGSNAWPDEDPGSYPGARQGPGGGGGGGRASRRDGAAADTRAGRTTTAADVFGSDGSPGAVRPRGLQIQHRHDRRVPAPDRRDLGIAVSARRTGRPCDGASVHVVNNGPDDALFATASFPIPAGTTFQGRRRELTYETRQAGPGGDLRSRASSGGQASFSLTVRVGCGPRRHRP